MTDRRRTDVLSQVRDAVAAGLELVQIRERDLTVEQMRLLAAAAVDVTRGTATRIVVNDRLDVALAAHADGVHLRADSIRGSAARSIAPAGFLVGRSVHTVDEAIAAAPDADYLIAGTVFPTSSKPSGARLLGVQGLRAIVAAVRVRVLAIGGVTLDRLDEVAATGAAGIAAISLFGGTIPLAAVADSIRKRFDSRPNIEASVRHADRSTIR